MLGQLQMNVENNKLDIRRYSKRFWDNINSIIDHNITPINYIDNRIDNWKGC